MSEVSDNANATPRVRPWRTSSAPRRATVATTRLADPPSARRIAISRTRSATAHEVAPYTPTQATTIVTNANTATIATIKARRASGPTTSSRRGRKCVGAGGNTQEQRHLWGPPGALLIGAVAVSYTHLTLPTNREGSLSVVT